MLPSPPAAPVKMGPGLDLAATLDRDIGQGCQLQEEPDRLRRHLHTADIADAIGGDRNHHHRTDDMGQRQRDAEHHLQRHGHDAGLDRQQDEGEGRIDQRGDCRSEIAEACAAGEQINIHAGTRRMIGNGQAEQKAQESDRHDRGGSIRKAEGEGDGPADRFTGKKGNCAQSGIGDAKGATARPRCGKAQGIVFQGLVCDPFVVSPSFQGNALRLRHAGEDPTIHPVRQQVTR